ncbi:CCR4 carbon catabolite repression 4-like [Pycnococcus provasolii]|uniref:CCR4 carbon catabolite repression 4-like n=1 Tax=Pycnococcus provasolii TaxID=41880 RepID=A0A830HLP2_9CHLO|nr:CCR4 carbon catabolite repression 4-like [Pycnococcus provasolii]
MLRRAWSSLPSLPSPSSLLVDPAPLRILTWNILADGLAQDGGFDGVAPDSDTLTWTHRLPLICAEIANAGADVICFQEASRCFAPPETEQNEGEGQDDGSSPTPLWRTLEPVIAALGYDGCFAPKRPSPCVKLGAPPDGVAVLWKKSRCELVGEPVAHYYPPEEDGKKHASQCLVVAHLADSLYGDGERVVTVVATHLKAKSDHSAIRARQARHMCEKITEMHAHKLSWLSESGERAFVLCGDMNDTRESEALSTLLAHDAPPLAAAVDAEAYPWTTWKTRDGKTKKHAIDHVVVERDGPLVPLRTWALPTDVDVGCATGLPTSAYPSDHVSVGVELAWRSRPAKRRAV